MRDPMTLAGDPDIVQTSGDGDLERLTLHYANGTTRDIKQAIVIGAETEYTENNELDVTVLFTGLNQAAIKFYIRTLIDVADRLGILQEIAEECRENGASESTAEYL